MELLLAPTGEERKGSHGKNVEKRCGRLMMRENAPFGEAREGDWAGDERNARLR